MPLKFTFGLLFLATCGCSTNSQIVYFARVDNSKSVRAEIATVGLHSKGFYPRYYDRDQGTLYIIAPHRPKSRWKFSPFKSERELQERNADFHNAYKCNLFKKCDDVLPNHCDYEVPFSDESKFLKTADLISSSIFREGYPVAGVSLQESQGKYKKTIKISYYSDCKYIKSDVDDKLDGQITEAHL